MSIEFNDLVRFELLLLIVCTATSALLALLWSGREVRGYISTERNLKAGLSLVLGLAIAVVSCALYIDFPRWLFLVNLVGFPTLCGLVAAVSPAVFGMAQIFKGWSVSAPVNRHDEEELQHRSSGEIKVPIKPITNISKAYRRQARRA